MMLTFVGDQNTRNGSATRKGPCRLPAPLTVVVMLAYSCAAAAQNASSSLTMPLAVDWKYTSTAFAGNPAAPVVGEGSVFVATGNVVVALDSATGSQKWQYPRFGVLPGLVTSSPTLSGDVLYFGAGDSLYALNADTGQPKWPQFQLERTGVFTSPVVVGTSIYFGGANGRLYALDTATGRPIGPPWSGAGRLGIDAGSALVADMTISNDTIYYATTDQALHAIDLGSGVQKWAERLDMDLTNAVPIAWGDTLFMAAGNTLSSFRARTGYKLWTIPLPAQASAPVTVDDTGTVYLATDDGYIYAVTSRGSGKWRRPPHVDYVVVAPPVVVGDVLVVGTAHGGVYAYDKETGTLRWNYTVMPSSTDPTKVPVTTSVSAPPTVAGDTLFVLTDDGTLTAFRHDAIDSIPPMVTVFDPAAGDHVNGTAPFAISAQVTDDGSGVNLDTLKLKLDDKSLPRIAQNADILAGKNGFTYDPDTELVYYSTLPSSSGEVSALPDGIHTATVSVQDWMGNETVRTWTFFVDNTLPRKAPAAPPPTTGAGGIGGGGKSGFLGGGKGGG